jgi:hypothetical protein
VSSISIVLSNTDNEMGRKGRLPMVAADLMNSLREVVLYLSISDVLYDLIAN